MQWHLIETDTFFWLCGELWVKGSKKANLHIHCFKPGNHRSLCDFSQGTFTAQAKRQMWWKCFVQLFMRTLVHSALENRSLKFSHLALLCHKSFEKAFITISWTCEWERCAITTTLKFPCKWAAAKALNLIYVVFWLPCVSWMEIELGILWCFQQTFL